ncbi:MAG: hypothetical protein H6822_06780 [Planctomycetaceae bacterium]|nr:hypothetical protein [Planctomycetales bacterium]MCB9921866.1 hypothetical protein [Planctomycetaceae bacterium]
MYRWINSSILPACLVAFVLLPVCAHSATEDERLEEFLTRLGLVELQTVHLEQVLAAESDDANRTSLARRLADVYASQLLAYSDEATKYEAVVQKINALLEKVPSAKTPLLEVMLLQADYYRAEGRVGKWIADRSDATSRADAQQILDRIAPELNRLQTELNAKQERLIEELNAIEDDDQSALKEKELSRLQAIVGRASYFAAWSSYYRGLTKNTSADYEVALAIFRQVLGVTGNYDDIDAEYLGLESIWRSRSLVGLALTEAALDHTAESDRCFELLNHASVPPQLRDQAEYWRLQSLLNVERYAKAYEFASQQIAAFEGTATQGQVSFCVALIQTAYAGGSASSEEARRLGALGLGGLIKLGQRGTAKQLMAKYEIVLDEDAGFYLRWLQGQQQFEHAEETKSDEEYALAAATLTQALRDPLANNDLASAGQCRSQLAWCLYRQGKYDAAGRDFQLAAERLIAARDKYAIDSAWMGFVAFQAASKSAPRFRDAAIDMLNLIKREFPTHEYAKRADYYIGKMRQNTSPTETLHSLEQVTPDAPDYLSALYEIATILYSQWVKATADEKGQITERLFEATDKYLAMSKRESDKSRLVRAANQATNVALNGTAVKIDAAAKYLAHASSLAPSLPDSNSAKAEYHFHAMQLAIKQGDSLQDRLHADWLVKNAAGSRYELAAIIVMARTMDNKVETTNRREDIEEAFTLYQRLVTLLGDSPDAIRASKNAQVANSKLASYAARLGRHDVAAQRMEHLLAASDGPPNKSYLRRAGLASFAAENYDAALAHWRVLVRGLPKGSDEWFEAKYYQLACLLKVDDAKGRIAYDQFKLLYPDLGTPAWRDKFEALH